MYRAYHINKSILEMRPILSCPMTKEKKGKRRPRMYSILDEKDKSNK
jgi:hypothetical protein